MATAEATMSSSEIIDMFQRYVVPNYRRYPVALTRGQGSYVWDAEGNRYLDFFPGWGCNLLGHCPEPVVKAVQEQIATLIHVPNTWYMEAQGKWAKLLSERSFEGQAFFCNSGTEANEAAIKLARKWAYRQGEPDRRTILACTGSFHGRTFGSLAATSNASFREGFEPLPAGFAFVAFNDVAALHEAIDDRTTAFIVEPVQGESGVNVATLEFLAAARELCDARGALLIFDEIQCGVGRTGSFFAFERFGVRPDVVTLAKGLANGLPIGAMLANDRAASGFRPGDHGSTFGGSPIPCAAALAHLRIREELDLDRHVRARSGQLFALLAQLARSRPEIFEPPRGMGLLAGLPVRAPRDAKAIVERARAQGLLIGSAGGNTLRFAPPLIVSPQDVERAVSSLVASFE